jgi:hypothetical protein
MTSDDRKKARTEFGQVLTEITQWHETHDATVDEMPPELVSRLRRSTRRAASGAVGMTLAEAAAVAVRLLEGFGMGREQ